MTPQKPPEDSHLNDPVMTALIIAVMVRRLGGTVHITQEDIDAVAYTLLTESSDGGRLTFTAAERTRAN